VAVVVTPVAVLMIETSTLGTAPPVASVTVPEMVPPVTCADNRGATKIVRNAVTSNTSRAHAHFLLKKSFIN
jgi:hypothetical protein